MKTSDFYYDLPQELIAQDPLSDRSSSRLMVLNKNNGRVTHKSFKNIKEYLRAGDCLVLNNTKVIPARLLGTKEDTGAAVEVFLLKRIDADTWETLVKPGKKLRPGARVVFGDGLLKCEIVEVVDEGNRIVKFEYEGIFEEILDKLGEMPLPPYITHKLVDKDRYQTVYSKVVGSSAAPTAGLHFTKELLEKIKDKGVQIEYVTLHVGLGTFRPVKVDDVTKHQMHSEYFEMSKEVADRLNIAKKEGRKIISVGTTTTRVLETVYHKYNTFKECMEETDIFIYPGFKFMAIDSLITNFHLPKSTLVMLVSALAGKDNILNAYKVAVEDKYRFFSFGDSMMISDFNSKK